eukprot:1384506-Prymnesium_polylepis.1
MAGACQASARRRRCMRWRGSRRTRRSSCGEDGGRTTAATSAIKSAMPYVYYRRWQMVGPVVTYVNYLYSPRCIRPQMLNTCSGEVEGAW